MSKEVLNLISEYCDWTFDTQITPTDELWEDLGLDDLDCVHVAQELELMLGIEIPDQDINDWKTVGCIINSVNCQLNSKNRA